MNSLARHRQETISGVLFIAMFLFAFVLVQPAAACEQLPQPGPYESISVEVAHRMIERNHNSQILILDVRYECEYNIGHLYGAVLIPYDQLQARINELEAHKNHEIIVYCRSGVRSQMACGILASDNFTKLYNMEGGILAWINTGYEIYTTYHHATVSMVDHRMILHIEPLILYQKSVAPCAQNQTCRNCSESSSGMTNIQYTLSENGENHIAVLMAYEINGTTFEVTVSNTLLWSYDEVTEEYNRTTRFTLTEIAMENSFMSFYGLVHLLQHREYNLTLYTILEPLDSEAYNNSFTIMNYAPVGTPAYISMESVELNSSVTLSQQYAILGRVAQRIGALYKETGDETLTKLAKAYGYMKDEAKFLSKLTNDQLIEYNKVILRSLAVLMDQCAPGVAELLAFPCSLGTSAACGAICVWAGLGAWVCLLICGVLAGTFCAWLIASICGYRTLIEGEGCAVGCAVICSFCPAAAGPLCWFCAWICESVCHVIVPY